MCISIKQSVVVIKQYVVMTRQEYLYVKIMKANVKYQHNNAWSWWDKTVCMIKY